MLYMAHGTWHEHEHEAISQFIDSLPPPTTNSLTRYWSMLTRMAQTGTMRRLSALLTSLSLVASRAFLHTSSITTKSSSTQSRQRGGRTFSSATSDRITLDKIAESLREGVYEKILVVVGAGISCSAGIPDFRTPGSGLYDNLHKYDLPYPEAIFDIDFYRKNPMPFVTLSKEIWPGVKYRPTLTHCFLSLLGKRGIIQRIYTQNIDGLESIAGVNPELLVECHGHFRSSSCIDCGSSYNADDCKSSMVLQGEAPTCTSCGGFVKPTIVFFGEVMPNRFSQLVHIDVASCDLVLVLGTSLLVDPVASIPNWVKSDVHRCLINRDVVGSFILGKPTDVFLEGECDESVRKLCQLVGWENELNNIYSHTRCN